MEDTLLGFKKLLKINSLHFLNLNYYSPTFPRNKETVTDPSKPKETQQKAKSMVAKKSIKFQCSYGGRILPRYPDGKLRYHGGDTRVFSVDRSISFAELMMKLSEMCETPNLRCQLPSEDMDSLISITCDEDLKNLIEEYDHAASTSLKIRAFVSSHKVSPPASSIDETSPSYSASMTNSVSSNRHAAKPPLCPVSSEKGGGKTQRREHGYGSCGGHVYMIHTRN